MHFCRVKIEVHNRRDGGGWTSDLWAAYSKKRRDCQSSTAMYFDTQMDWYIYWPLVAKWRNLKPYHFGNTFFM